MIRVAVTGATGRMGREVVRAVTEAEGMTVVAAVDPSAADRTVADGAGSSIPVRADLGAALDDSHASVLVDFTHPSAVAGNVGTALERGVDCVVGTTGLSEDELVELASTAPPDTCLFVAPNFAIGAVLMMRFAEAAARYMPAVEIVELHHDKKADAPSGTALRTAKLIDAARSTRPDVPGKETEQPGAEGARGAWTYGVPVHSVRLPGLVAHQEVLFGGQGQTLTIRHDSIDRTSFMPGVVHAIRAVGSRTGLIVGLEHLLEDEPAVPRPLIVTKFGGTSVATPDGRASLCARITELLESGSTPVVVVSAMGRAGDAYATDTLLSLVEGLPAEARERDLLASTGEIVAAVVVAHEMRETGIAALAFSGTEAGIYTDAEHGEAAITEIDPTRLMRAINSGHVPVVAGFQGAAPDGSVATLGRGGSDTTACALGIALEADEVHIYTDVDGVMTADPRTCTEAQVIDVIGADELFQMARHGSKVVHRPAAELALTGGLAVRVRNTYTAHPGTEVADIASYRPESVATAVSHREGVSRIRVPLGSAEGSPEHTRAQARAYRALADAGVSLDMFTPTGEDLVFTVGAGDLGAARRALDALVIDHDVTTSLAKVTLVGAGMHGVPGVMARVAECLGDADVDVLQTADSHTTISVLVRGHDAARAVSALHTEFELGP